MKDTKKDWFLITNVAQPVWIADGSVDRSTAINSIDNADFPDWGSWDLVLATKDDAKDLLP